MQPTCLEHRLTDEERRAFNETGLLMVENALSPEQVAALTGASDRIFAQKLEQGHDPRKSLFYPNFIPDDPLFADLVGYPVARRSCKGQNSRLSRIKACCLLHD